MTRKLFAAALVVAASLPLIAQQAPAQAPPPGGRRGGGIPGGGPEIGLNTRPPNAPQQMPAVAGQTRAPEQKLNVAFSVVTVTEGLVNPWGLAFLPDGKMLVTERPGRLRVLSADGKQMSEPVTGLPAVDARGQGGLLDVALDPAFQKNQLIYWSYAEPGQGVNNTAVARGRFVDGAAPKVENVQVIFHQAPSLDSPLHFGGRLNFGRDGTLFITLGDRSITEGRMQAQRTDGLLGKIVRLNTDGSIPKDNPFVGKAGVRPEIWSLGHRNIQAATFNPATGELWEVEHGTRGGDEVNIARKGKDYGWPTIAYGIEYAGGTITGGIQKKEGMEQPHLLLGSQHRAERHGVLHGPAVPGVAGEPLHRRTRQHEPRAAVGEGRQGRGRGASAPGPAAAAGAAPRRAAGARRRALHPDRQRQGQAVQAGAERLAAVTNEWRR